MAEVREKKTNKKDKVIKKTVEIVGTRRAEVISFVGELSKGNFGIKVISRMENKDGSYSSMPDENDRSTIIENFQVKEMLKDSYTLDDGSELTALQLMQGLQQMVLNIWEGEYDIKTPPITDPLTEEEEGE